MLRTTTVLPAALLGLLLPAHGVFHAGHAAAQSLATRSTSAATILAEAASPDGRPVVLMLHGRGMQDQDTTTLRGAWTEALDDGIAAVSGRALLGPDDFRLVWYADALDPSQVSSCETADDRGRREAGWARDVSSTLAAAGTLMGLAARWMEGPEGAALEALAGDLVYLGDARRRCGAEERLARELDRAAREGRPVILVAHSFGSLVAYHHLRTRDAETAPPVERLVTVGSLLGHPELREILLDRGGGPGPPPGVGSWVNVRDPADPLAAPLIGVEDPDRPGAVEDRTTERPAAGNPHDPARYLSDPATAEAVFEAWRSASSVAPESPAGSST